MAGVGEASAVVAFVTVAANLSKAIIDVAHKYKTASAQIESFGRELGVLGDIIHQLSRLYYKKDPTTNGDNFESVTRAVLDQCTALFTELQSYRDALYENSDLPRRTTLRARAKWIFQATEMQYLRARVDSMKINMLLMMMLQLSHTREQTDTDITPPFNKHEIKSLSIQSGDCVKQLETLEETLAAPTAAVDDETPQTIRSSIASLDNARQARSTRDSILSLLGLESYDADTLALSETSLQVVQDPHFDLVRASQVMEDCINNVLAEKPRESTGCELSLGSHEQNPDGPEIARRTLPTRARIVALLGDIDNDFAAKAYSKSSTPTNTTFTDRQSVTTISSSPRSDELGTYPHERPIQEQDTYYAYRPENKHRSFRITLDDSCSMILQKALQKYDINADPNFYSLLLLWGDNERCVKADENPLVVFNGLYWKGEMPYFMLRRTLHEGSDLQSPTASSFTVHSEFF